MNTPRIEDTTHLQEENIVLKRKIAEYEARIALLSEEIAEVRAEKDIAADDPSRFRMLLDYLPQMAWAAIPDGWIGYFNKHWYAYTGQSAEEAEGFGWQAAIHPDDRPGALELYNCMIGGQESACESRILEISSGAWRWHLIQTRAIRNQTGK